MRHVEHVTRQWMEMRGSPHHDGQGEWGALGLARPLPQNAPLQAVNQRHQSSALSASPLALTSVPHSASGICQRPQRSLGPELRRRGLLGLPGCPSLPAAREAAGGQDQHGAWHTLGAQFGKAWLSSRKRLTRWVRAQPEPEGPGTSLCHLLAMGPQQRAAWLHKNRFLTRKGKCIVMGREGGRHGLSRPLPKRTPG